MSADFWFAALSDGADDAERRYTPLDALDCGTQLCAGGTALFHEPETAEGAPPRCAFARATADLARARSRLRHAAQQPRQPAPAARGAQLEFDVRRHTCRVGRDG